MSLSRFFILPAVAGLLPLLSTGRAENEAQTPDGGKPAVTVEGFVMPEQEVELAAPSAGLVTEVIATEGTRVKKGDVIARLSDEEEEILLKNAELQAEKLRQDFLSMERLFRENAASKDEYTKSMLASRQGDAERDLYKIRLEKRSIVAPCDANVLRIFKEPGESVQQMEKFAELVAVDRLHVTAYVDAVHLGKIPAGTAVSVLAPATGSRVPGKVLASDPVLDAGGSTFRIKVLVEQPGEELLSGMRVRLELPLPGSSA